MTGKGLWDGLKSYVGALLVVLLFPLFWARSFRLARRHADADPRGVAKVAVAIVVSVAILASGLFVLLAFQADAQHTMYTKSLDQRLSVAVGESDYQTNVAAVEAADVAIPIIERNLANATDEAKKAELQKALDDARTARNKAVAEIGVYSAGHDLYERLVPAIRDEDDQAIRSMVAAEGLEKPADMEENVDAALAIKDRSVADMHLFFWLFLWPSLAGAFLAPVVFATGSILGKAFEPSDTVGYKKYPGAAAGWFLLFGAFGVPSIPFAAWTYLDLEGRSTEGQIAL